MRKVIRRRPWAVVTAVKVNVLVGPIDGVTWPTPTEPRIAMTVFSWHQSKQKASEAADRLFDALMDHGQIVNAQSIEVWARSVVEDHESRTYHPVPVRDSP